MFEGCNETTRNYGNLIEILKSEMMLNRIRKELLSLNNLRLPRGLTLGRTTDFLSPPKTCFLVQDDACFQWIIATWTDTNHRQSMLAC